MHQSCIHAPGSEIYNVGIMVTDLVKLINETHPLISQDESTSFKRPLPSDGTTLDISCQTHGRGSLTGREYWTGSYLLHILEKL